MRNVRYFELASRLSGTQAPAQDGWNDREPPNPMSLLARFGLLLAVATSFGFCAQFLVAMSH